MDLNQRIIRLHEVYGTALRISFSHATDNPISTKATTLLVALSEIEQLSNAEIQGRTIIVRERCQLTPDLLAGSTNEQNWECFQFLAINIIRAANSILLGADDSGKCRKYIKRLKPDESFIRRGISEELERIREQVETFTPPMAKKELRQLLGVSARTLCDYLKNGKLPCIENNKRTVRVSQSALDFLQPK